MKNDQRHTDAETEPGSTNPSMHLSRGCFQEINSTPPVDPILIDYRFVLQNLPENLSLRVSVKKCPHVPSAVAMVPRQQQKLQSGLLLLRDS